MNPSSTLIRAGLEDKRHVIPCPPKPMRTYTKVLSPYPVSHYQIFLLLLNTTYHT
jgi:hypothetical protein